LLLADTILVPSPMFAATLRSAGHRAHVLPHAWSADNALWAQPPAPRHTVNIGWLGGAGQVEDLALIRRVLIRLAREFPQIQIVVGGEPQAFHLFDSLPEGRKLYLPPAPLAEVPYQLSHLDILVEPLRTTPFHRTLSDRQVMHASARGLAWVASPTPSHRSWADGGVTADDPDEWHTQLRRLVEDPGLRAALGEAGRLKAQEREATRLAGAWLDILRAPPPSRSALVASGAPAFIPPAEASVQWRAGASARAAV
jgi:glycosyltransferase involved in cell wall biosynthesis